MMPARSTTAKISLCRGQPHRSSVRERLEVLVVLVVDAGLGSNRSRISHNTFAVYICLLKFGVTEQRYVFRPLRTASRWEHTITQ
jgi:hypothetical protein